MRVERLEARGFRNLADLELPLGPGLTVALGPNGSGKTNLLEALYFGLTGRSCRTRRHREMVAFGRDLARVEVDVGEEEQRHRFLASVERSPGGSRRHLVDGSPASALGSTPRPAVAVFMPDRLSLVKGPPSERRAHLDRLVAALWPTRVEQRARFGHALAQRNALLAGGRASRVPSPGLDAWDREFAREAMALIASRREAAARLAEPFAAAGAELGLRGEGALRYLPRSEAPDASALEGELRERRDLDLRRGHTTHGPHLDEIELSLDGRSIRRYGSQGEQRTALLSLLFAERALLIAERGAAPLMLLDDVMSELDPERRELLLAGIGESGQALLTATHPAQLPECHREEVRVREGRVVSVAAGRAAA